MKGFVIVYTEVCVGMCAAKQHGKYVATTGN